MAELQNSARPCSTGVPGERKVGQAPPSIPEIKMAKPQFLNKQIKTNVDIK